MLQSQSRFLLFQSSRATRSSVAQFTAKRYSSSSVPPAQDQNETTTKNLENEQADTTTPTVNASSTSSTSSTTSTETKNESSKIKKRIKVQASTIPSSTTSASTSQPRTRTIKLPSVPSTQYLDSSLIKKDMFYGGYRPLLTPIRKPIVKSHKKPTIPPTWNVSACRLETFDDYSNVPQFVVDKLIPFNVPQGPGNEIRLGLKSRKEEKESERLSKEVLRFIKYFRK